MECKKMCLYLVNIEDIEEVEWLFIIFLKKGNGN